MQQAVELQVSVVIVSHRPLYVEECLACFTPEVCGEVAHEVIVVADYPVEEMSLRHKEARWVFHQDRSISAKRNVGIKHARAPVVAFTDDDCRPGPNWLPLGATFLADHPSATGVEGKTKIRCEGGQPGLLREFRRLERPGFRTNNIFYRKQALEQIGGFDERFTVQREDIDCAFSIIGSGGRIEFLEQMEVDHCLRSEERWDLLKNCVNRRFDPLLHKKHRALYRRHIGSPFTPSLAMVLLLHAVVGLAVASVLPGLRLLVLVDLCAVSALAVRRTGLRHLRVGSFAREWLSALVGPLVLLWVLIRGSVRFRTLFIM